MYFVDAICQQYFIPILWQHFLIQTQSFMFSFMQTTQILWLGNIQTCHFNMVENSIEKTWCSMLEEIFDFSSFEDDIEISK